MSTFMERFTKIHGKRLKWSEAFKAHVARQVINNNYTYAEASIIFDLKGVYSIGEWVRQYKQDIASDKTIGNMNHNSPCVQSDNNATEQIQKLQRALEAAHLQNTALSALIDLAESTYNISIRKNSGTK